MVEHKLICHTKQAIEIVNDGSAVTEDMFEAWCKKITSEQLLFSIENLSYVSESRDYTEINERKFEITITA